MTPSRSKTTASITRLGSRRRAAAAAARRGRARRARRGRRRSVWSPASCSPPSSHSSQPTRPSSSGPRAPSRTATPSQSAIGGTPRAKCCASAIWSPARSETAKPPASRRSSWNAAWCAIEIPTSGGSSASETSEATRQAEPLALEVDRDDGDPDGIAPHAPLSARSPLDTARDRGSARCEVRRPCRAGRRRGTAFCVVVHLQVEGLVVRAERLGLPVDVRE